MGQGVFAKHDIKRGELIFSERPLLVGPSWLMPVDIHNVGRHTLDQWRQVMISEEEQALEVAVQRMNETDRALYMALHNSHTTDGSGPLYGIMRTNGFGVSKLSHSANSQYGTSVVCNVGSRVNHRYFFFPFLFHSHKLKVFNAQHPAAYQIPGISLMSRPSRFNSMQLGTSKLANNSTSPTASSQELKRNDKPTLRRMGSLAIARRAPTPLLPLTTSGRHSGTGLGISMEGRTYQS